MFFKKHRKLYTSVGNQMEVTSIVVTEMKESMATLEKDSKSMVSASTEDKNRLKKLEEDNKVLKQKTDAILDILCTINEKLK